ncbi:DMT family transporter [Methanosarcina sp. KYL-1]|nr:DMT family transporter [Methanosarcina sp. KYL-1]
MAVLLKFRLINVNFGLKQGQLKDLLFLSVFQPVLFFSFQALGLLHISSSEAGVINALIPIFVGIFGMFILGETLTFKQFFSFFVSVAGIFYLFMMKGGPDGFSPAGVAFTLLSVFSTSIYIVTGRKLSKSFDPMTLTFGMMANGALVFLLLALGLEHPTLQVSLSLLQNPEFMFGILYLSLFTSVGTSFLTIYSLGELEASKSAVFMNLCPVIAVAAGVLVLHEEFRYYHLVGSFLIIAGVVFFSYSGNREKSFSEQ